MTKQRGKTARLSPLRSALLSTPHKALPTKQRRPGVQGREEKCFTVSPKGNEEPRGRATEPAHRETGENCRASTVGAAPAPRKEPAGAGPPGKGRTSQADEQNAAGACDSPSGQTPRRPGPPSRCLRQRARHHPQKVKGLRGTSGGLTVPSDSEGSGLKLPMQPTTRLSALKNGTKTCPTASKSLGERAAVLQPLWHPSDPPSKAKEAAGPASTGGPKSWTQQLLQEGK
ncbi:hypothetical protein GH733_016315 [Mirounga leonina]|nr:hypothetical protein GH733_016315 [Mirounga leonina]